MLARIRISVPDRPGSLGSVASAIGSAGGDIAKVDVLESEAGRALDDVFVTVRDPEQLARVTKQLSSVPGVTVIGSQHPAPPITGHADLELLAQVLARPERGPQTLVDGAPGALGADWGALLEYGPGGGAMQAVVAVSPSSPPADLITVSTPLRLTAVQLTAPGTGTPYGGAALVPVGTDLGLLLVRTEGPPFHQSELWRLGQIGDIAATALAGLVAPEPA